jgi:hypothetical protein
MTAPFLEALAARSRSSIFTLSGKWRQAIGWTTLTLLAAATAGARSPIGPSSSASIEIRVSVAPSYALKTDRTAPADARYCLAASAVTRTLPILLVRPASSEAQRPEERAAALGLCEAAIGRIDIDRDSGLLIIRPE